MDFQGVESLLRVLFELRADVSVHLQLVLKLSLCFLHFSISAVFCHFEFLHHVLRSGLLLNYRHLEELLHGRERSLDDFHGLSEGNGDVVP